VLSQRVRDDARRVAREERVVTDRALAAGRTSSGVDPADALALSEQVSRALDRMEPDDRELLLLRVWDELPFADVAAVLGCSPGAARVRWLRARRRFAAALTREEPDAHTDADPSPPAPGVIPLPLTVTQTGDPR
jgi:RNA polymerase sigma-70 factor (ECF subfamily)